jgi:hypothetical protein
VGFGMNFGTLQGQRSTASAPVGASIGGSFSRNLLSNTNIFQRLFGNRQGAQTATRQAAARNRNAASVPYKRVGHPRQNDPAFGLSVDVGNPGGMWGDVNPINVQPSTGLGPGGVQVVVADGTGGYMPAGQTAPTPPAPQVPTTEPAGSVAPNSGVTLEQIQEMLNANELAALQSRLNASRFDYDLGLNELNRAEGLLEPWRRQSLDFLANNRRRGMNDLMGSFQRGLANGTRGRELGNFRLDQNAALNAFEADFKDRQSQITLGRNQLEGQLKMMMAELENLKARQRAAKAAAALGGV